MKIRTAIFLVMTVIGTALFISCTQEEEEQNGGINPNITFELEVSSKTESAARILVKHSGSDNDPWYGFLTDDLKTDEEQLIQDHVEAEFNAADVRIGNNQYVSLSRLEAGTTYRYIISGMTSDGTVYGNSASKEFTTEAAAPKDFTLTEDWSVEYTGRQLYKDGYYPDGVDSDLITIKNPNEQYYYFVYTTATELEYYYQMTIADFVEYQVELVAYMIANGYGTVADLISNAPSETLYMSRFMSGEYIGIVIGYESNGTPTYTYSYSEFTVPEEEAETDYTRWLGKWDITCNEADSTRTYTIEIKDFDNNFMYEVAGWETNGDVQNDIREYVGEYTFPAYYEKGKLQFVESELNVITFEGDESTPYYFGFFGLADYTYNGQTEENQFMLLGGSVMAEAEYAEQTTINGMVYSYDAETVEFTGLFYWAYTEEGNVEFWNYPMYLPLDMKKVENATATSGVRSMTPARSARPLVQKSGISAGHAAMRNSDSVKKFGKGINTYQFGRQATILNK